MTLPRRPWLWADRARRFPLLRLLDEQVVVADGAIGTRIQQLGVAEDDWAGLDGCNEILCESRPDLVRGIHEEFCRAGAELIETNSFGGSSISLAEYGIGERSHDLCRRSAILAREVATGYATSAPGKQRFVAGSVGSTAKLPSLGHVSFAELRRSLAVQARGLLDGGVDAILIETVQDILQAKAAVLGARDAMAAAGCEVPILASVTVERTGTMLLGTEVAAALVVLEGLEVDVVGLNCGVGPDAMVEQVRWLGSSASRPVAVMPNAGLPRSVDGKAVYDMSPEELAGYLEGFVREHGVALVGGCCGTGPEHVRAIARRVAGLPVRPRPLPAPTQAASLYQAVAVDQDPRPLLVGERTNASGSKRFRELLAASDWDGVVEMARQQASEGAHVLDLSVAQVGRDETADVTEVLGRLVTQTSLPLVIDSTRPVVLAAALEKIGGRPLINSVNLEEGESKADRVCELARDHGAILLCMAIDEQGMARDTERKVAVAKRLHDIAVRRHGMS
ncbi:MAG: homocysteine S-methyltransferase family protein, partial [Pseudomonadota bacterium]